MQTSYGYVNLDFDSFSFSRDPLIARSNGLKLLLECCNAGNRKYFFSTRIAKIWSPVPHDVVIAISIDNFKTQHDSSDTKVS